MKMRALPLLFDASGKPIHDDIYGLAHAFASEHLAEMPKWMNYRAIWLAAEINSGGQPVRAHGMLGTRLAADVPLCRFLIPMAGARLVERVRGYYEDLGGRGAEVLLYIDQNDPPEARCVGQESWLARIQAEPAQRWSVTV